MIRQLRFVVAALTVAPPALGIQQGLVAHWAAESTPIDQTGNGNDGTLENGATFGPGIVGQAFSLDGDNDYVFVPPLSGLSEFSIVAWFKRDGADPIVFEELVFQNALGWLFIDPTKQPTEIGFLVHPGRQGVSDPGERGYLARFQRPVLDGEWHHLGLTATATNDVKAYFDGEFLGNLAYDVTGISANYNLGRIGVLENNAAQQQLYFNGLIDEVAVYDRVLSDQEVAQLYAAPFEQGIEGYWPGDSSPDDESGNGHHGALEDQATYGPGIKGEAFSLDGDGDYVSLPMLSGLSEFSMVASFQRDNCSPIVFEEFVFQTGMGWMAIDPTKQPTEVSFVVHPGRQGVSDPGELSYLANFQQPVLDGEWHHLALTATTANDIRAYFDGQFLGALAYDFSGISANHDAAAIGVNVNSTAPQLYFDGLIDDVALYDRVLSDQEIERIFATLGNEPPVADAGMPQPVHPGDVVILDGRDSFDDNTASTDLLYCWTLSPPPGSLSSLVGATTPTPSFTVDALGTYVAQLVVTDELGLQGEPSFVSFSSENIAPVADAGIGRSVVVGSLVALDGGGSEDGDEDPITFAWTLSVPAGSMTTMTGANTVNPSFTPDTAGPYNAQLIVHDGYVDSLPSTVVILAITAAEFAESQISDALNTVSGLPASSVTTKGNQNALVNFLRQAILALQANDTEEATDKLEKAIDRVDGWALRGAPDGNGPGRDWITDSTDQLVLYNLLSTALAALQP